MMTSVQETN